MTPLERRRARFIDMISGWSETRWSAGWYEGAVPRLRSEALYRRDCEVWLLMAAACDGWPRGYRAADGWVPLSAEERARVRGILAL